VTHWYEEAPRPVYLTFPPTPALSAFSILNKRFMKSASAPIHAYLPSGAITPAVQVLFFCFYCVWDDLPETMTARVASSQIEKGSHGKVPRNQSRGEAIVNIKQPTSSKSPDTVITEITKQTGANAIKVQLLWALSASLRSPLTEYQLLGTSLSPPQTSFVFAPIALTKEPRFHRDPTRIYG
jgi:hypothetical protein